MAIFSIYLCTKCRFSKFFRINRTKHHTLKIIINIYFRTVHLFLNILNRSCHNFNLYNPIYNIYMLVLIYCSRHIPNNYFHLFHRKHIIMSILSLNKFVNTLAFIAIQKISRNAFFTVWKCFQLIFALLTVVSFNGASITRG